MTARDTVMTGRATRIAGALLAGALLAAGAGCAAPGTSGLGASPSTPAIGPSAPVIGPSATAPSATAPSAGGPSGALPTATAPPTGTTPAGTCSATLVIHSTDDGKSLCVTLGGTVDVDWAGITEPEPQGTALQLVPVPMREQTDRYKATSRGMVTFTSARRACTPSPGQVACGALMLWTVTVEVK